MGQGISMLFASPEKKYDIYNKQYHKAQEHENIIVSTHGPSNPQLKKKIDKAVAASDKALAKRQEQYSKLQRQQRIAESAQQQAYLRDHNRSALDLFSGH